LTGAGFCAGLSTLPWSSPGRSQIGGVLLRDPIRVLKERNWPSVVAFVDALLASLDPVREVDDPEEVAADFIDFVSHVDPDYQRALSGAFTLINLWSIRETGKRFGELDVATRKVLLNQGECRGRAPSIRWEHDFILHTAVSSL